MYKQHYTSTYLNRKYSESLYSNHDTFKKYICSYRNGDPVWSALTLITTLLPMLISFIVDTFFPLSNPRIKLSKYNPGKVIQLTIIVVGNCIPYNPENSTTLNRRGETCHQICITTS